MSTAVSKHVNQALSVEEKANRIYLFYMRPAQELILPQNMCSCTQALIINRNFVGKTEESFLLRVSFENAP